MEVMEEIKQIQKYTSYSIIRPIGKGAFGQVYEAEHIRLKTKVAIKQTKRKHINKFNKEVFSLRNLTHPNIVSFIYVFMTKFSLYLVMELVPGCDLYVYLKRNNMKLEENTCRIIGRQLSSAIYYMHSQTIAHRDIKPDNIMIDETTMQIKLVDFGLSGTVFNGRLLTSSCGTEGYMAPEICKNQPYDLRADMWSTGVTFYVMITGILPDFIYMKNGKINEYIDEIIELHFLVDGVKNTTAHFQNMLASLLQSEPSKRMDSLQLSTHPWITKDYQEPLKTHGYKPLSPSNRFKIYEKIALLTNNTVRQTVNILRKKSLGSFSAMYRLLRQPEFEKQYNKNCDKKPVPERVLDDSSEFQRKQGRKRALEDYSESPKKLLRRQSVDTARLDIDI
ncbi:KP78b [Carabus blaptoides fortunei]